MAARFTFPENVNKINKYDSSDSDSLFLGMLLLESLFNTFPVQEYEYILGTMSLHVCAYVLIIKLCYDII